MRELPKAPAELSVSEHSIENAEDRVTAERNPTPKSRSMLLVMGNPAEEKKVFDGFVEAAPMFAGVRLIGWSQPKVDPPDIECDLADGRKLGVELTSWLEESQIGSAKSKESFERSIFEAIQPEPPNETEHIHFLWMSAKRRILSSDASAFREEILGLIREIDRRWETEPDWESPQGFQWSEFSAYPTVGKYLEAIEIRPRIPSRPSTMTKGGRNWLTFPMRGGSYSPSQMVDALCEVVEAKIAKYAAKPIGMAEFHLLVHYDKAWAYNTPVIGIDFGYADAVQDAAKRIGPKIGMFDKIFVFVPIADGEKVFRM